MDVRLHDHKQTASWHLADGPTPVGERLSTRPADSFHVDSMAGRALRRDVVGCWGVGTLPAWCREGVRGTGVEVGGGSGPGPLSAVVRRRVVAACGGAILKTGRSGVVGRTYR